MKLKRTTRSGPYKNTNMLQAFFAGLPATGFTGMMLWMAVKTRNTKLTGTTHRSKSGKKVYAVRDQRGRFITTVSQL